MGGITTIGEYFFVCWINDTFAIDFATFTKGTKRKFLDNDTATVGNDLLPKVIPLSI